LATAWCFLAGRLAAALWWAGAGVVLAVRAGVVAFATAALLCECPPERATTAITAATATAAVPASAPASGGRRRLRVPTLGDGASVSPAASGARAGAAGAIQSLLAPSTAGSNGAGTSGTATGGAPVSDVCSNGAGTAAEVASAAHCAGAGASAAALGSGFGDGSPAASAIPAMPANARSARRARNSVAWQLMQESR
jgi:hypothetical protein